MEIVDQAQRLASSRLGRLMSSSREMVPRSTGLNKVAPRNKPIRVHTVQSHMQNSSFNGQALPSRSKEESERRGCAACGSFNHLVWRCDVFTQLTWTEKKALVRRKCLCFNCLGEGHRVNKCPSKARCKVCHQDRHSLLHSPEVTVENTKPSQESSTADGESVPSATVASQSSNTLLSTVNTAVQPRAKAKLQVVPVSIVNPRNGLAKEYWALLGSGADTHLLTQQVYSELQLKGRAVVSTLQLADGKVKTLDSYETECEIRGMNATDCFELNEVRVVDRLPDLKGSIPAQEDLEGNDHLSGIDIPVIENDEIDLLIGTGAPALHAFSEVRRGGDTGLWVRNTPLGWVLFGQATHQANVVVDTGQNPADLYSRSVSPTLTNKAKKWLQALAFLLETELSWPRTNSLPDELDGNVTVTHLEPSSHDPETASSSHTEDDARPKRDGEAGKSANR